MALPAVMKKWDVTTVGEVFVDHVLSGFETWPKPGEELVTDRYTREIGGGAAITACGLSRLGRSVKLLAVIGAADASWFEQRLAQFGVDATELRIVSGWTGTTLSVSTRDDRSFFTHPGVNVSLHEELLQPETIDRLTGARHVHFAMPLAQSLAAELLPALAKSGTTVSLDVGFQPQWLRDPANLDTCRVVDYLLPNEKEAALICGSDNPEDFFVYARKMQLRSPVLKRGVRGAMRVEGDVVRSVVPPQVTALDSTGAGDAFDAGFIDAMIGGESAEECLRRACICGALSTRAAGALNGLPNREELWSVHEQTYKS
jgi:sugar/nucleoside kinase (ribokinase family)